MKMWHVQKSFNVQICRYHVHKFHWMISLDIWLMTKVLNGQLRLVLLKQLGQAVITKDFDVELMKQAILANQHG